MIAGIGIDLCDAARMEKCLTRPAFTARVFSAGEQALLAALPPARRAQTAAANFAAKEAFLKAAGTGLGGFALSEVGVLRRESGAPYFALTGKAAAWAEARGVTVHVSLTHENGMAAAFVVAEAPE